jgi:hypothetical protein
MITISYGDYPELMEFALSAMREVGFFAELEVAQIGDDIYRREIEHGIDPDAFASIARNKILFLSYCNKSVVPFLCEKYGLDKTAQRRAEAGFFKKDITATCHFNDEFFVVAPDQKNEKSMILAAIMLLVKLEKLDAVKLLEDAFDKAQTSKNFEEALLAALAAE